MTKKQGKSFEDRLRKRLVAAGCYVLKLPDAPGAFIRDAQVKDGGAASSGGGARFSVKNPFDFLVLRPWTDLQAASDPLNASQLAASCATAEVRTLDYEFEALSRHGNDIHLRPIMAKKAGDELPPGR